MTTTYEMASPYKLATLKIATEPRGVVLNVDDVIVQVDAVQLDRFNDLEVTSFELAWDGYDSSILFLLGTCYNDAGDESGRVVISIVGLEIEEIRGETC